MLTRSSESKTNKFRREEINRFPGLHTFTAQKQKNKMKLEIYKQILGLMHTYGSRDGLKSIALQFPG